MAIGTESYGSDGENEVVELWNGARWIPQPAAVPQGVTWFYGVTCAAFLKCMIVGQTPALPTVPFLGSQTFAERWDGSTWSVAPTSNPQPSGGPADDMLHGISCTDGTCIAVGWTTSLSGESQTLIEQYP